LASDIPETTARTAIPRGTARCAFDRARRIYRLDAANYCYRAPREQTKFPQNFRKCYLFDLLLFDIAMSSGSIFLGGT
jgi:hypothetical protein